MLLFLLLALDEVLKILLEAGNEGLRLRKIVLHVYNTTNSLFHPVDFEEVRKTVEHFVHANSRRPDSLLVRNRWGVYRINNRSKEARQLRIRFEQEQKEGVDTKPTPEDLGPTLF